MRFGIFLAPFHPHGQNPNLALHRDLELIEWLDHLGFDEAWIGEHHSAGYEIIASPEVFIAAAAERTRNIKLGTGVSSLPYHHPLILADRIVLLDHLTRGRFMFGVGPGALPSDAFMMGIDPVDQRRMMEESLEAIIELLAGEIVDMETDWFTLRDARLQVLPYTRPRFEIAVAAMVSPSGPRLAGKHGLSLLSIGATQTEGFNAMENAWSIMEERAAEFGTSVDRDDWRLVGPMHIAATREQAKEDVKFGLDQWIDYFVNVGALPIAPQGVETDKVVDLFIESGFAVIGTPDDAIAADRASGEAVRRVRLLPVHGARLGRPRRDDEVLRALRQLRHAELQRRGGVDEALARLGCGEPAEVHAQGRRSDHELDPARTTRRRKRRRSRLLGGDRLRSSP